MTDNVRTWLHDILTCINEVDSYFLAYPKNFEHYLLNAMLRKAVERNLEIIGEATSRILKEDSEIRISEARKIVDFRNIVIHGYDVIDDASVWSVVCDKLPLLKAEITELLNQ